MVCQDHMLAPIIQKEGAHWPTFENSQNILWPTFYVLHYGEGKSGVFLWFCISLRRPSWIFGFQNGSTEKILSYLQSLTTNAYKLIITWHSFRKWEFSYDFAYHYGGHLGFLVSKMAKSIKYYHIWNTWLQIPTNWCITWHSFHNIDSFMFRHMSLAAILKMASSWS